MQINAGIMNLFAFIAMILICVHVSSCLWYLTAKIDNYGPETWVVKNNFQDESIAKKYLASLYWAIFTTLTVGYGDIHAHTIMEKIMSTFWMMIGVAFYAFTIGMLPSVLAKMDTRESYLNTKIEIIDEFCTEANISH
jgi:ABC-type phosphate transport system permease subunit